jgi:hypothetical protein
MILLTGLFSFSGMQNGALAFHYEPCLACPLVVVETDKSSYVTGDNVTISGHVSSEIFKAGEPVILLVSSPIEELVKVEVQPAADGTFSYSLPIHAGLMNIPESYDVRATHGAHSGGTSFNFMLEGNEDNKCGFGGSCQYELMISGTRYEVDYSLNGVIQNITIDNEAKSLLIDALVNSNSSFLYLELNPELISASEIDKTGQERIVNFTVLINGERAEKTKDSSELMQHGGDRLLVISKLEEGQNRVEIIGTSVIPEFGLLVLLGVTAGIVSVLIALSRSKIWGGSNCYSNEKSR